jgi:hypothetical protein
MKALSSRYIEEGIRYRDVIHLLKLLSTSRLYCTALRTLLTVGGQAGALGRRTAGSCGRAGRGIGWGSRAFGCASGGGEAISMSEM